MMRYTSPDTRFGRTLMEVLVAAVVLSVLAGLLFTAVQKAREAATRSRCQQNLKHLAFAAHSFHATRQGFPAGEIAHDPPTGELPDREYYSCWIIPLLPHIGEGRRAAAMAATTGFVGRYQGGPSSPYGAPIPVLVCPADVLPASGAYEYHSGDPAAPTYEVRFPEGRYDAVCSYGANWGTRTFRYAPPGAEKNGVFHYNTRTRVADITDGTASTVLLGERSHREPRWAFMGFTSPAQQNFAVYARWYTGGVFTGRLPHEVINYRLPAAVEGSPPARRTPLWIDLFYKRLGSYGSEHPGGCNLVMADGSVRFVADFLTLTTLHALATRSGGETILTE